MRIPFFGGTLGVPFKIRIKNTLLQICRNPLHVYKKIDAGLETSPKYAGLHHAPHGREVLPFALGRMQSFRAEGAGDGPESCGIAL